MPSVLLWRGNQRMRNGVYRKLNARSAPMNGKSSFSRRPLFFTPRNETWVRVSRLKLRSRLRLFSHQFRLFSREKQSPHHELPDLIGFPSRVRTISPEKPPIFSVFHQFHMLLSRDRDRGFAGCPRVPPLPLSASANSGIIHARRREMP